MAEWIDMVASVFACIGVAIALVNLFQLRKTYLATHERTCKQTTIEFFNELKKESEEIEKKLFLKYGLEPIHLDELEKIRSTFSEIGGEIKHSPTFYNSKSLAKTK